MAQRVGLGLSLAERKSEDALTTITAAATNSVERRQCSARERSKKACGLYVQRVRLRLSQSRHARQQSNQLHLVQKAKDDSEDVRAMQGQSPHMLSIAALPRMRGSR